MTQEEKQLLLKDLCARLTYGVKVWYKYSTTSFPLYATSIRLAEGKIALSRLFNKEGDWFPIIEAEEILIKPYLRLLSSMTEEEEKEYNGALITLGDFMFEQEELFKPIQLYKNIPFELYEFFNAHHFDYHGLIEKGLALEAPEGMYK